MTCARLVALKSPLWVLMVTPFKSMLAFTVVKRTLQSLRETKSELSRYGLHDSDKVLGLPLLFDHVQEVTMIDYPFEYRAKCEPVMPAECCRKSKNRNSVLGRSTVGIALWTLDFWVKEG
jgi:hypothetical protein